MSFRLVPKLVILNDREWPLHCVISLTTVNNLTLNRPTTKTKEVIFHDNRRRHSVQPPPLLPGVARDFTLKVLVVTLSSHLSASDHIRRVITAVTARSRCMPCSSYGITV